MLYRTMNPKPKLVPNYEFCVQLHPLLLSVAQEVKERDVFFFQEQYS